MVPSNQKAALAGGLVGTLVKISRWIERTALHPIIEANRTAIEALCRRFHVRTLDLFGSAAREDFDAARSDVDFLVAFDLDASTDAAGDYFGFKRELEALLGRPVDLVSGTVENPYLKKSIDQDKVRLYPGCARRRGG